MQLENAHGFSPWSNSVTGMIPNQNRIASLHEFIETSSFNKYNNTFTNVKKGD